MILRRSHKGLGNEGSTLIEIIISVLIIGIAFVPLMGGMSEALKANTKSESMLYSDQVASGCLDVAKIYGTSGFETAVAGGTEGDEVVKAMFGDGATVEKDAGYTSTKPAYLVKGIKQGTKNFQAVVSFDGTGYTSINDPANYTSYKDICGNGTKITKIDYGAADIEIQAALISNEETISQGTIVEVVPSEITPTRRSTTIEIFDDGYKISKSKLNYTVSNGNINGGSTQTYSNKDGYFESNITTGDLSSLIILYTPICSNEEIKVVSNLSKDVSVYVMVGNAVGAFTSSSNYTVTASGSGASHVKLYCNKWDNSNPNKKFGKEADDEDFYKVYDVSVKVYDTETNVYKGASGGEPQAEVSATAMIR